MKRDDYKKIEALIEKYFNAETSLEEESIIKSYYKNTPQQEMPESLLVYKDMFGFFEAEKEYIESPKREYRSFYRPMLRWGTVAAAAILLITFFLITHFFNPSSEVYTFIYMFPEFGKFLELICFFNPV